jgi:nicotinamide-nucleotide adenylyltransferase
MENKPFKLGILVGRFQTIHSGHEQMIRTAAAVCERAAIFVGSSQESGTQKNPFSYELRREMLKKVFGAGIEIYPLPDIGVGNNARWGDYVLKNVHERCGELPDLLASGKEERRISWFDSVEGARIAELYIPKTIDISASRMREMFLADDRAGWQSYTPAALWEDYDRLRPLVIAAQQIADTDSL